MSRDFWNVFLEGGRDKESSRAHAMKIKRTSGNRGFAVRRHGFTKVDAEECLTYALQNVRIDFITNQKEKFFNFSF